MSKRDSTSKESGVSGLIAAINHFLTSREETIPGIKDVLANISSSVVANNLCESGQAVSSNQQEMLQTAISNIEDKSLLPIRDLLKSAEHELVWRQDDSTYYSADADLGEGYKASNLHTLLIAPANAKYYHPDFTLGFFLLGPFTLYRDHFHLAPELYVNLSPVSGWRLDGGEWRDYGAGSLIWNGPNEVHATRSYDHPFFSIFSWVRDTKSLCKLAEKPDWERLEKDLHDKKLASIGGRDRLPDTMPDTMPDAMIEKNE